MNTAERIAASGGWILFALTALWAIFFVPMNMDEALPYHILACFDHPFAHLHTLTEGCDGRYDLTVFSGFRIAGGYHYVGALSSILYAPFYFLFHAPQAQYWFGLLFLIAFALLLSRLTPKPRLSLPVILAFFPLIFQFIHDTGPVKFSLLAFPLGALLFRRIASTRPPLQTAYAIVLAALVLLAAEDKIFFIYLLPSFALFGLAFLDAPDWPSLFAQLKPARGSLALAATIILFGLFALLLARMGDYSYIGHLAIVRGQLEKQEGLATILITYLLLIFTWPAYAHRVFDMEKIRAWPVVLSILLAAGFIAACTALAWKRRIFRPLRPRAELLILSIFAALLIFLGPSKVWAGHHFIFLWVPALVLLGDILPALEPKDLLTVTLSFFAINIFSIFTLAQTPVALNVATEQNAIFDYFADEARASQTLLNYSSWGGYFIEALYGPQNLLVTYKDPLDDASAQKLLAISRSTGRRIYNVCIDPLQDTVFEGLELTLAGKSYAKICSKQFLEDRFGGKLTFEEIPMPGLSIWHVFAATPR